MASRADTNTNRSRGRRERTSAGAILTAAMWHDTMLRLATALICDSMGQALKLVHAVCMEHTEPAKGTNRMNLLTASLGVKTLTRPSSSRETGAGKPSWPSLGASCGNGTKSVRSSPSLRSGQAFQQLLLLQSHPEKNDSLLIACNPAIPHAQTCLPEASFEGLTSSNSHSARQMKTNHRPWRARFWLRLYPLLVSPDIFTRLKARLRIQFTLCLHHVAHATTRPAEKTLPSLSSLDWLLALLRLCIYDDW